MEGDLNLDIDLDLNTPIDNMMLGRNEYRIIDKDIICTEFAPDIFAHLRHIDGFTNKNLSVSLDPELDANIVSIFKAGEGMGKSGSFFFFSHDGEFLIKTMTQGDFNAFKKIFIYYFEHVNTQERSLLARIYGIYSVQMDD